MPARRGDLKRAFDGTLPHDMRKIKCVIRRGRRFGWGTGRQSRTSCKMVEQRGQVGNRQCGDARSVGCFLRVLRRYINRPKTRVARGHRHRQRAADRTKFTRQRQFTEKDRVLRRGVDFARRGKDGKQDG